VNQQTNNKTTANGNYSMGKSNLQQNQATTNNKKELNLHTKRQNKWTCWFLIAIGCLQYGPCSNSDYCSWPQKPGDLILLLEA